MTPTANVAEAKRHGRHGGVSVRAHTPIYLALAPLALACGWLVGTNPLIAIAVAAAVAGLALAPSRAWIALTWISLVGLVLLSYGFNNVPATVGPLRVPLVDVLLIYALFASAPHWWPFVRTRLGQRVFLLLVAMTVVSAVRLFVDVPRFGAVAGRDALYVLEAWGVFVGIALGRLWGLERLHRWLGTLWGVAMLWFLLYPFRDSIIAVAPTVGVQRPTPLISFTSAGFVAAIALFWFAQGQKRSSLAFGGLALVVLLVAQSRGQYLAVVLTLIVGLALHIIGVRRASRAAGAARVGRRFVAVAVLGLLVVAILPPLSGRVGEEVSVGAVSTQMMTLFGEEGPGAGSAQHRAEAWPDVVRTVDRQPVGWLVGVGYGPDLFGGFTVVGDVDVRKPHNDFLEVWARTGILGLVPWLLLLTTLGWWALRTAPEHPRGWWLVALQMAMLMAALTQPAFGFAYLGLTYMVLMGAVIGSWFERRSCEQGGVGPP